jgi:hypothetical protein
LTTSSAGCWPAGRLGDGCAPTDRIAGLLVLLFGQRPRHISRLTVSDTGADGGRVTITFDASLIELPQPFAGPRQDSHRHATGESRQARRSAAAGAGLAG